MAAPTPPPVDGAYTGIAPEGSPAGPAATQAKSGAPEAAVKEMYEDGSMYALLCMSKVAFSHAAQG